MSSSGVRRRLEEACEVLEDIDGPGVVGGDDGIGGGVSDLARF